MIDKKNVSIAISGVNCVYDHREVYCQYDSQLK